MRWVTVAAVGGALAGASLMSFAEAKDEAAPAGRAAIEAVVRDYILAHPEIIPQAMERLQGRETARLIDANRAAIETPFASAWSGAAKGDATLVIFTDYACGYCRASVPDIDRLIAEDRNLKVVWRELPVLGPGSDFAARAGLAAARQGKYLDFHRRMFAAGRPDEARVTMIERMAGLDPARSSADRAAPDIAREIETNLGLARTLGVNGTPSFVVGGKMLQGAVGYDALKKAIAETRAARG